MCRARTLTGSFNRDPENSDSVRSAEFDGERALPVYSHITARLRSPADGRPMQDGRQLSAVSVASRLNEGYHTFLLN